MLNPTVKALQSFMNQAKGTGLKTKVDSQEFLEWEMACNTNCKDKRKYRGNKPNKVWSQEEINALYSRDDDRSFISRLDDSSDSKAQGASKTCHKKCHNGNDFIFIVVKRHQTYGYIDEHADNPDYYHTGNQMLDEIRCWKRFEHQQEADYLCPILKYFTSRSDKVEAISETMQENIVIIAQKAVFVGDLEDCCIDAARRNAELYMDKYGEYYDWQDEANSRYAEMIRFSDRQNWRDAIDNPGNSGVIYDYDKQMFKAVFIDYAL